MSRPVLVYSSNQSVFCGIQMLKVKVNRRAFEVALLKKSLSQRDLARLIGFSRAHVSFIIAGKRQPSATMRRKILEQLRDYTFDDLFIIEEDGRGSPRDG